jgi:nucleoside-diphosphate-sugar epimerase
LLYPFIVDEIPRFLGTSVGKPLLRAAEMESFGRQLPILVVRPNNIYGPRQFPEKWGHQWRLEKGDVHRGESTWKDWSSLIINWFKEENITIVRI